MTNRDVEEAKIRGVVSREWWESPEHVKETEALLIRAGCLSRPFGEEGTIVDCDVIVSTMALHCFRSKPWKWDRERTIARVLERTFEMAGIIPVDAAWAMTGAEVMAEMQKRDAKRGLR